MRLAWSLLGLLLLSPRWARADDAEASAPPRTFELVYSAPAGCPTEDEFLASIQRTVPEARRAAPGSPRRFVVTVDESGRHGQLGILQDGTPRGVRPAEGANCAEVSDVLAFAAALALDPDAAMRTSRASERAAPPAPAPAPAVKSPPAAPAPPRPTPDRTSGHLGWGLAAHGSIVTGVAPSALYGVGGSVTLRLRLGPLDPSLRLGFEYGAATTASVVGAHVDFSRLDGVVEPCPHEWRFGPFGLRPCVRLDVGQRTARASDVRAAERVDQAWVGLGPSAHARWSFVRPLYVEIGGALAFALTRDRAFFAPDVLVYDVPAVGGVAEIALGFELY